MKFKTLYDYNDIVYVIININGCIIYKSHRNHSLDRIQQVLPMAQPTGTLFYIDYIYGNSNEN